MTQWKLMDSAPKDGRTILGYMHDGVSSDYLHTWPSGHEFTVFLIRWKIPDSRSSDGPGWFAALFDVNFGPWDDPSTDFCMVDCEPEAWMPLPDPPEV